MQSKLERLVPAQRFGQGHHVNNGEPMLFGLQRHCQFMPDGRRGLGAARQQQGYKANRYKIEPPRRGAPPLLIQGGEPIPTQARLSSMALARNHLSGHSLAAFA
jgi:hypothetical protein